MPRIVEINIIERHVKNDFRLTSSTYRNNVHVDILEKHKQFIQTTKNAVVIIEIQVKTRI